MIKPCVFFVGASGVGKTTLAKRTAARLSVPYLASPLTPLAKEYGGFAAVDGDPELRDRFQREACGRIADAFRQAAKANRPFACDRSLDVLAYTSQESASTWEIHSSDDARSIVDAMRDGRDGRDFPSLVFFVRPHPTVNRLAQQADGQRRYRYLEWDYVCRTDGVVQYLLEAHAVPYVVLHGASYRDKTRTVDRVVELACRK